MRAKVISSIVVVAFYLYLHIGLAWNIPLAEPEEITAYGTASVVVTFLLSIVGTVTLISVTLKWLWKEE